MRFKNKMWVVIKSCKKETAWYADKVGTTQRVTDELFPTHYTLISKYQNGRGLYPMIDKDEAEIITPSMIRQFLLWMGTR